MTETDNCPRTLTDTCPRTTDRTTLSLYRVSVSGNSVAPKGEEQICACCAQPFTGIMARLTQPGPAVCLACWISGPPDLLGRV